MGYKETFKKLGNNLEYEMQKEKESDEKYKEEGKLLKEKENNLSMISRKKIRKLKRKLRSVVTMSIIVGAVVGGTVLGIFEVNAATMPLIAAAGAGAAVGGISGGFISLAITKSKLEKRIIELKKIEEKPENIGKIDHEQDILISKGNKMTNSLKKEKDTIPISSSPYFESEEARRVRDNEESKKAVEGNFNLYNESVGKPDNENKNETLTFKAGNHEVNAEDREKLLEAYQEKLDQEAVMSALEWEEHGVGEKPKLTENQAKIFNGRTGRAYENPETKSR